MVLKRGYKQTEIGVIPESWDVLPLEEFAEVIMGQSPAGSSYNRREVGIALINGPTEFTDKYPVKIQWTSSPTKLCGVGDVLLCVRGSSTGRINISNDRYCIGRGVAAIRARENSDGRFLEFAVQTIVKTILSLTAGSTFPNIDGNSIRKIIYPLPPLPEQQAIATVLGDVDALLASLDALIAKKRLIQQGAMQELLTGKRRLPGFSGEWKPYTIGEIYAFLNTANNSRSDLVDSGEIEYVHYGDIHTRWKSFLDCSTAELPFISFNKVKGIPFLKDGDLIMADASEDYAGIGVSVEVKNVDGRKIVAGLHTLLLRGNKDIVADGFKGYLLYLPHVKDSLIKIATGISVYGISKNNLKNISMRLPSPDEQRAIARVLSDMEADIYALEQQRDKTHLLKQGMMQELLTGRTRLV